MNRPITFDDFQPGAVIGEAEQTYDAALSERWQRIFGNDPADGPAENASLATVMMMRAYLAVVTPRPPGNVHARQRLSLKSLPRPGETIRNVVSCLTKEMRRGRRYVDLAVTGQGSDGHVIYDATLTLIWAA